MRIAIIKSWSIISTLLAVLVLIVSSLLLIPLVPTFRDWYQLVVVKSASMEPAIGTGSLVIYRPASSYEVGQIIVYQPVSHDRKQVIIHRVVDRFISLANEVSYSTQGDANSHPELTTVYPSQIKGRVILTVPGIGYAISWLQTSLGLVSLVLVPVALAAANELVPWP